MLVIPKTNDKRIDIRGLIRSSFIVPSNDWILYNYYIFSILILWIIFKNVYL